MGVLRVKVGGSWVDVTSGGSAGGGSDEVVISSTDPIATNPTTELWYNPTAPVTSSIYAYRHVQGTPAASWTIIHNLGWYPNVVVEDSGGSTCEGETVWNDENTVTMSFSAAFAGVAYLS